MEQLGHSSISVTYDLYRHLFPNDEEFVEQQTSSLQAFFSSLPLEKPTSAVIPLKSVRKRLETTGKATVRKVVEG